MTTDLRTKLSCINSFIDESFDVKQVENYKLLLQVGNDGLLATVYDRPKNKFIAFENFAFQQVFNQELIADLLEVAKKDSRIIGHKYKNVICSVVNNLSTLVPAPIYEDDRKKMYLKFNTSLQGDELIMADTLNGPDAKNIFALPFSIKTKLDGFYSNVTYHHFSSAIIESLFSQYKNVGKKQFFIHIHPSHFEAIVIEEKKLLFYNTFNHHTAEDLIYYLLFVCEQLQLNPETIELTLIGEIDRTSAIYNIIQKYIRNIKFGARSDNNDFSYQLQSFPKHFYFSLFNSYLI